MLIGQRIRHLRQQNGFSQGDLERATGLLRCYISRVEHGHTVPSLGTLEKFATALKVPLYQLFYENEAPATNKLTPRASLDEIAGAESENGTKGSFVQELKKLVGGMSTGDRALLIQVAEKMARR